MSTRTLLALAFAAVAAVLTAVVLLLGGGDEPGRTPERPLVRPGGVGSAAVLPTATQTGGADARPLVTDLVGGLEESAAEGAPEVSWGLTGRVRGRLLDASGRAVEGEPVALSVTSDPWWGDERWREEEQLVDRGHSADGGRFELAARPGATHVLLAGGGRWAAVRVEAVASGDDLEVRLPASTSLAGRVIEQDGGAPVSAATVVVLSGAQSVLGTTDEEGAFTIAPVPDDVLVVAAYAQGYDLVMEDAIVPAAGLATLVLPPGRPIVGQVLDRETSAAIEGAEVRFVLDVEARVTGRATAQVTEELVEEQVMASDADGRFQFAAGPSHGFRLEVSADGYVSERMERFERRRTLRQDEEIAVRLRPVFELTGDVKTEDADGRLGSGAGAALLVVGPEGVVVSGTADERGAFALSMGGWEGEGPTFVEARDEEGRRARLRVRRDVTQVELRMVPPLTLDVLVVSGQAPLAGAHVAMVSDASPTTLGRTGPDGLVTLVHPLAGPDVRQVDVSARHGADQSLPVSVEPRGELPDGPLVLDVASSGWITGQVFASSGQLLPGARVRATQTAFGHSDVDGRFRLGPMSPGAVVTIWAEADGFHRTTASATVGARDLVLVLQPVVRWDGRVLDATTGLAVPNFFGRLQSEVFEGNQARFEDRRERLQRDRAEPGAFQVELPEPGRYRLRMMARDYIPIVSLSVDFDGLRAPPPLDIVLSPAAVLEITVRDSFGRPVRGYAVAVVDWELAQGAEWPTGEMREAAASGRTDGDGLVRFNLHAGGAYRIAGGARDWLDTGRLAVLPGPAVQRTYRLGPTGDLALRVRDEDGQPVAGLRLDVRSADHQGEHWVVRRRRLRAAYETVTFEAIPPGDYRVSVRHSRYESRELETYVGAGTNSVEVVLRVDTEPGNRRDARERWERADRRSREGR